MKQKPVMPSHLPARKLNDLTAFGWMVLAGWGLQRCVKDPREAP